MTPQAREQGLIVRQQDEELLVYDPTAHRAHALNPAAALVWKHCDGKTTVAELATLLHQELSLPADEEAVWLALDRLERAQLLPGELPRPARPRYTRREVARRLGLAG